jgi:thiamine-phosphate pyrophosphorylase
VGRLARAGVTWIQIRAKNLPDDELARVVEASCEAASAALADIADIADGKGTGAALWIDDRADLAALFPVAGLHLGQTDLPPAAARRVVGEGVWIGRSTHDLAQVVEADADPDVDVIALGPVFTTGSKQRPDPVVGLAALAAARAATSKPLVAIGGIGPESLQAVLDAGADTAAVIDAVCRGGDLEGNLQRLGGRGRR